MNQFTLSETEYNDLGSVRSQLNLVAGLLCAKGANSSLFDAEDLLEFLSKQADSLRSVIRAVDKRYELKINTPPIDYTHWVYALRIAAGDAIHTPIGAEVSVTKALTQAAQIDPDMNQALAVWIDVLGQEQVPVPNAAAKKPVKRKRDKLAEKSLEVV